VFCARCGTLNVGNAQFCSGCGYPLAPRVSPAPAETAPPPPVPMPGGPAALYAGFWRRFAAMIIDSLLFLPFGLAVGVVFALMIPAMRQDGEAQILAGMLVLAYLIVIIATFLATWLYFTLMESSRHQGTLGKKALGLYVTDMSGNRISFARANGRYFGKWVSSMILNIGYLMAGFTERKQALHDMLAGCLVLRR
jgi:uncharacterized RDD family membrane protein YckC